MSMVVNPVSSDAYAAFPPEADRDWLSRVAHLSEDDVALVRRRADPVTQLGYAVQLATVRAIGTFQSDPSAVPEPVVAALAGQLGKTDPPDRLAGYWEMPVRWRHTAEIRDRYGYREFTAQPDRFAFTLWLYRQSWQEELPPSVLFRAAHRQLLARQILLPGQSVLSRLIATVRERATARLHQGLATAAPAEVRARLEKLLTGPQRRMATLLAYTHTLAGSARDDVLDLFDVVFGDMQRAATHRGEQRRAGQLREYDQAVAAVHARLRTLLDTLDD